MAVTVTEDTNKQIGQNVPQLQSYQAQTAPELRSYQAQEVPELQSYQAQEIPILQAYQAQTAPELRSYQAPVERINDVYDQAINAQRLALENQYNLSRAAAEHSAEQIPQYYQQQMRQASTTAARNQQAFNESAAGSGLNIGAGSQARLAQNNALQNNLSSIGTAQANAESEAQFQLMQLEQQYQNAIAEAVANNEYERAAALMQEYKQEQESTINVYNQRALLGFEEQQKAAQSAADTANQQALLGLQERQAAAKSLQEIANQRALLGFQESQTAQQSAVDAANQKALLDYQEMLEAARSAQEVANRQAELNSSAAAERAALLAQYGDFSGYAQLYGNDAAGQMAAVWARQNPDVAYSMGLIDANTYTTLTGKKPTGKSGYSPYSYEPGNGDDKNTNAANGNLTDSQRQFLVTYLAAQAAGNDHYLDNLLEQNPYNLQLSIDAEAVLNAVANGANISSLNKDELARAQQLTNMYAQAAAMDQAQPAYTVPGSASAAGTSPQATASNNAGTRALPLPTYEQRQALANAVSNAYTSWANIVDANAQ